MPTDRSVVTYRFDWRIERKHQSCAESVKFLTTDYPQYQDITHALNPNPLNPDNGHVFFNGTSPLTTFAFTIIITMLIADATLTALHAPLSVNWAATVLYYFGTDVIDPSPKYVHCGFTHLSYC